MSWSERPKVATGRGRQVDLQDREVRVRIAAHDVRVRDAAVRELHSDRVGVGDDVVVGDDVAGLVHDDAGAQAALDALPVAGQEPTEQLSERRGRDALA